MSLIEKMLSYFSFGRYAYPLYIVMDIERLPDGFDGLFSIRAMAAWYGWPLKFTTIIWTVGGLVGMGLLFRLGACIVIHSTKGGRSFFKVLGARLKIWALAILGSTNLKMNSSLNFMK